MCKPRASAWRPASIRSCLRHHPQSSYDGRRTGLAAHKGRLLGQHEVHGVHCELRVLPQRIGKNGKGGGWGESPASWRSVATKAVCIYLTGTCMLCPQDRMVCPFSPQPGRKSFPLSFRLGRGHLFHPISYATVGLSQLCAPGGVPGTDIALL